MHAFVIKSKKGLLIKITKLLHDSYLGYRLSKGCHTVQMVDMAENCEKSTRCSTNMTAWHNPILADPHEVVTRADSTLAPCSRYSSRD